MSAKTRVPWIKKVALKWDSDECLLWPFSTRGGRGDGRAYPALIGTYAHIVLCELVNGPRPEGMEAEHTCGNRLCMNWKHLRWSSHKENCARRTEHGSQTIGERHGRVKLTEAQVLEIRKAPKRTRGLGEKYRVSNATISLIRSGKNWKHLK